MRIRSFSEWSVKPKLLLITAGLILVSVFIVSTLSYRQYTKDFEQQSSDRIQQILDQLSINIDTYLDDLFRLSLAPYRNEAVMDALDLSEPDTPVGKLEKQWLIEQFMDDMMIIPRKDILGVLILTETVYYSGRIAQAPGANRNYQDYEWYKQAMNTQDHLFVPSHRQEHSALRDVKLFSIVKQIRSIRNTERILGVIKVDANYKGIEDIMGRVDMGREGGLYVIDDKGETIYASSKADRNRLDVLSDARSRPAGQTLVETADGDFLVNSIAVPRADWTVIAVHSVKELNKEAAQTRNIAFLLAVLCSLLAIVILYMFVKSVMNPLLAIVKLMKEVERGRLQVQFEHKRKDEIGYLGTSFNTLVAKIGEMLERNTSLVKEVYEAKLLQKEAQIQTLYNQIRPHFIFNTLNMISLSMQSGQEQRAIEHIGKLSSLLRGMTVSDQDIPLEREIELLDAYLGIQSSRYEGRLDYIIDIPPELRKVQIPALLLQPIVENAVIHGCETKRGKTTIRISGDQKEGCLFIAVSDDGSGMNAEKLAELRSRLSGDSGEQDVEIHAVDQRTPGGGLGVGLVNVHRRIQLKYGRRYGLEVDSAAGSGTVVRLSIPVDQIAIGGAEDDAYYGR